MKLPPLRTILPLLLLILWPSATAGDWLVLRDGTKIETDGAWTVEGSRVLFELPNGTLSSLRATDVDLDASHEATEAAAREEEAAAREEEEPEAGSEAKTEKKPVLVLTDDDIPTYRVAPEERAENGEPAVEPGKIQNGLRVADWQTENTRDGLLMTGRIENTAHGPRSSIRLRARIHSAAGEEIATVPCQLTERSLPPGESTSFRAELREIFEIDGDVSFEIESSSLTIRDRSSEEG